MRTLKVSNAERPPDTSEVEASSSELYAHADRLAEEFTPRIVQWRREFHRHPELGFRELHTARRIAQELTRMGMDDLRTEVGGTGLVATLRGATSGPTVAIRADMDGLPITEKTGKEYASEVAGRMHACGHDAHMAIALGAAEILGRLRHAWRGEVKFIFQPAEEGDPSGGTSGAPRMLQDGVLQDVRPEAIFALHVMPSLRTGQIGCQAGPVWAGADLFTIRINGRQTHGAYPHTGIDAIVVAAHAIIGLQSVVSRKINPLHPTVLTVGEIHGGLRPNIIAGEALLSGTVRSFHAQDSETIRQTMEGILSGIASAFGAQYRLEYEQQAPVTRNHPQAAQRACRVLESLVGTKQVLCADPQLGAEDFAYFAERAPAVYFLLGVGNEARGIRAMLHSEDFDLDEEALPLGVRALCRLTLDRLQA